MEKIQKSIVSNSQTVDIYLSETLRFEPAFCPICSFSMSSVMDFEHFKEYECCSFCFSKFVEPRKKIWKNGWRPSNEQIEEFKNFLRLQSPSFILE
tara:strand:+ start:375 stop:662 length:288 start_codon:yes stop_codon:yes gene_type:complete